MSNLIIFGAGEYLQNRINIFSNDKILAILDNNAEKIKQLVSGIKVVPPKDVYAYVFDAIVIMAGHVSALQMYEQLMQMGIDDKKIFISDREYFKSNERKHLKCYGISPLWNENFIFTPNLSNTGGFRALLYALPTIQKHYGRITVISPCDGDARREVEDFDIIITSDISPDNETLWHYLKKAERILLNGLYYGYLIPYVRDFKDKKILWWIHTGKSYYSVYPLSADELNTGNVHVCCVSSRAKQAYQNINKNATVDVLSLGIPCETVDREESGKIIFAIIGSIEYGKGVDIFISAVENIPENLRSKCEFWIIGNESTPAYVESLKTKTQSMNNVIWMGYMPHNEIIKCFSKINVLVSASRDEALSIVAIEAFMNQCICIVSDASGIADYITDGKDGLIFSSEDVHALSSKMMCCILNQKEARKIGNLGRLIYDNEFSLTSFEERISDIF